jgi:hypothetical protein
MNFGIKKPYDLIQGFFKKEKEREWCSQYVSYPTEWEIKKDSSI